jgi:Protein of unknown function (DUF2442)
MPAQPRKTNTARAKHVSCSRTHVVVRLDDGSSLSAPLDLYPRLFHGSPRERAEWRLIAGGEGIHWPRLDEEISVKTLLTGKPSPESQSSLDKWLGERAAKTQRA